MRRRDSSPAGHQSVAVGFLANFSLVFAYSNTKVVQDITLR